MKFRPVAASNADVSPFGLFTVTPFAALEERMSESYTVASGVGGNGVKAYQCGVCESLITYSDRTVNISGSFRHRCYDPEGAGCDIYTFSGCPGAIPYGIATDNETWFPGYQWTPAFCLQCGGHVGWCYQALQESIRPTQFWGILVSSVRVR